MHRGWQGPHGSLQGRVKVKLLVLGADSLLGRALVQLLQEQAVPFRALDTQALDLLRKPEVIKAVSAQRPDQVVNVATYGSLEQAEADSLIAGECDTINTRGLSTLAEVCRDLELPLLHHSSSLVFDGQKVHPYSEDDSTNPVSRYGMSKWYGERAIREVLPRHLILRTDQLFSREQPALFRDWIDCCKRQHGRLELMPWRTSPTPARDVARVLLAIARQLDCDAEQWGTYHYCALQPMSLEHFAESFLQEAAKYDPDLTEAMQTLELVRLPVAAPWIPNTVLSSQRLFETFGIKQRTRTAELNAVLQTLYGWCELKPEPEPVTPDKGDIADRAEDAEGTPRVRKPKAAASPAKKAAARKASPRL